jgi:predicted Holliday junction resolvase-like endonuclease
MFLVRKQLPKSSPEQYTLSVDTRKIEAAIQDIPNKITQSIVNSSNTYKGAVGELIGYLQLKASYDRILPLGDIVDFVAIQFTRDGKIGRIDFIDVKTGDNARLSKDQRALRALIQEKHINFIQLKVTDDTPATPTIED